MNEIFVKIEEYKELSGILQKIDDKLREGAAMIQHLEKLKAEEDQQLATWAEQLQHMQSRSQALRSGLTTK